MSDSNNPFVAPKKRANSASQNLAVAWSVAGVALAVAVVLLVVWKQNKTVQQHQISNLRTEVGRTAADLAKALAINQTNQDLIVLLTSQITELQREQALAGHLARTLEDEMRDQLESKDVTISKLQGKLTVTIVDRVMFDSGESILKPDGAAVMQKIADLLAAHPELKIHVIGHTDNIPIRQAAQSRFASNWELSASRALAAVHFLTEKAGVDPRRLGAVGYGEFHPIADNSTAEGRAKNRRIAITILPDELVAPDAAPMAKDHASTNSIPVMAPDLPGK